MLELSPLLTAANASASSIPASISTSRSKPEPGYLPALEARTELAEGVRVLIDDRHRVTLVLEDVARVDPTRPHPMITICTGRPPGDSVARSRYSPRSRGQTGMGEHLASRRLLSRGADRRERNGRDSERRCPGRCARADRHRTSPRWLVRGPQRRARRPGQGGVRPARAARRAGPRAGDQQHGQVRPRRGRRGTQRPRPGRAALPVRGPGRCGGCDLQHARPAAQRAIKAEVVSQQLRRIAASTARCRWTRCRAIRRGWAGAPGSASRSARTGQRACASIAHARSSASPIA